MYDCPLRLSQILGKEGHFEKEDACNSPLMRFQLPPIFLSISSPEPRLSRHFPLLLYPSNFITSIIPLPQHHIHPLYFFLFCFLLPYQPSHAPQTLFFTLLLFTRPTPTSSSILYPFWSLYTPLHFLPLNLYLLISPGVLFNPQS